MLLYIRNVAYRDFLSVQSKCWLDQQLNAKELVEIIDLTVESSRCSFSLTPLTVIW